jgi:hypothetical protein
MNSNHRIEEIMIGVRVGPDEIERFIVRKDLATRHSDVIKKSFASGWEEAKENIVRFPEESPEAFQVFVTFLDTGVIHMDHFKSDRPIEVQEGDGSIDKEWNQIAQACLLGEHLGCTAFKDALVDRTVYLLQNTAQVPKTMFQEIFAGSVAGSGIRDLLVDVAAYHLFATDLEQQSGDDVYASYWKQVAIAYKHRTVNPSLRAPYDQADIGCKYHDHAKNKRCYKSMFT